MDQRNLFGGLDCELHAVREQRSHAIFADVYKRTVAKVDRAAKAIAPKHCHFSMSERTDYVQEGYAGLWKHIDSYRWICPRCGSRYSSVWGFDVHGCKASKPKHAISEYASFVTRRAMKHYQVRHIAVMRDERFSRSTDPKQLSGESRICPGHFGSTSFVGLVNFVQGRQLDSRDLVERKDSLQLIGDLACVEADDRVRFLIERVLDGHSTSEIYDEGLDLGIWPHRRAAYSWLCRAKSEGAFAPYAGALLG